MMTPSQQRLLFFIDQYMKQGHGIAPTYTEMVAHMNLKSKSGIHRLLLGLEERGFIRRLPNRARALQVVKTQAGCCPTCQRPLS